MKRPNELEDRLIDFSVNVIDVVETLPNAKAPNHIANQLVRSGTSAAPNYAEARSAESRRDFVHKMKVALKELRETLVWLKVINKKGYCEAEMMNTTMAENDELISIFVSSIKTARDNDSQ